jgi:hypothetical protein
MINSFYFIAFTRDRPIDLDWGVIVYCQLVQQIVMNETFSHAVFFGQSRTLSCQSPTNMISKALSKPMMKHLRASLVSNRPHLVGSALLCYA